MFFKYINPYSATATTLTPINYMANINLQNAEIIALGDAVVRSYCLGINEEFNVFKESLTGNLRTYEKISDAITDYLNDDEIISDYLNFIEESALKIDLKKWMIEKKSAKYNMLAGPWVSSNNLRKLIFYGPKQIETSFKEFFVFGCYIYTNVDRVQLLKELKLNNPVPGHTLGLQQFVPGLNTINPYNIITNKTCSLIALDTKKGEHTKLQFEYAGEPIFLKRENLDPNNNTITSKVQASIYAMDNEWYIENQSELKTTFIQITKPTRLEKGDIIVFGNKYFLFEG